MRKTILGIFIVLIFGTSGALAKDAHVIKVRAAKQSTGTWRFDVTIKSVETGWKKYANKWDVVAPNGTVLKTRTLLHPHVNEQPFTRGLSGVRIPAGVTKVTIRAHDLKTGYGGKTITVELKK